MENQTVKLSHSISRLLGTADDVERKEMEGSSSSIVSRRTVKRSELCGQDEFAQQNNVVERFLANSRRPEEEEEERCVYVYPWMTKRRSRGKKRRSKRILIVYREIPCSQSLVNTDINKTA